MKGARKQITSCCVFVFIFLSSHLLFTQAALSGYTIFSRISLINLPPTIIYRENYPNQTLFEFDGTLEIINNYTQTLSITSSTTCLVFYTGILSFENETLSGTIRGPELCGNAFTTHYFDPGITEGYVRFKISVNNTLSSLPDGNFTIWTIFDDSSGEHSYIHYPSIIQVNGSDINVVHTGANENFTFPIETSSTPTSTIVFSMSIPCFLGILVILLRKYVKTPKC